MHRCGTENPTPRHIATTNYQFYGIIESNTMVPHKGGEDYMVFQTRLKRPIRILTSAMVAASALAPFVFPIDTSANSENIVDRILPVPDNYESDQNGNALSNLIIMEEDIEFTPGETFRLTLSPGVEWLTSQYPSGETFNGTNGASFTVMQATTRDIELEISGSWEEGDESVNVPLFFKVEDALGDLKITVDPRGSTLSYGQYTFATVPAIITKITADKAPTLIAGQNIEDLQNLETAALTFKEGSANSWLSRNNVIIEFPEWTKVVGYKLIEVNGVSDQSRQELENKLNSNITGEKNTVEFSMPTATSSQTERSFKMKFYISSQADSEGDVPVKISGGARVKGEAIIAKVVPPQKVEENQTVYDVVFKVGNTTYSKVGVDIKMDIAPFIEGSRTYLPIRYVAEALGVIHDNIQWDEKTGQVTIEKDEHTTQLTIGSNVLKVNGKETIMDVPVKNVKGRTVLPLSFVTQALGSQINWDETNQTITLKVKE